MRARHPQTVINIIYVYIHASKFVQLKKWYIDTFLEYHLKLLLIHLSIITYNLNIISSVYSEL